MRYKAIVFLICIEAIAGVLPWNPIYAQDESKTPAELVQEGIYTLKMNPLNSRDAQRLWRRALSTAEADRVNSYQRECIDAYFFLGESYYEDGMMAPAVACFDSVQALANPGDENFQGAEKKLAEIDSLFKRLVIKIRNRKVPLLSFVQGIEIEFRFPQHLTPVQQNRLRILQSAQDRRQDELQFIGIDEEDGSAYMAVDYFPLITLPGQTLGYSLIVDRNKRYRFNFTPEAQDTVKIIWEDEGDWELVEKVQGDMVKLELPLEYNFQPAQEMPRGKYFAVEIDSIRHIYIPAAGSTELLLSDSQDKNWERLYQTTLLGATGLAALMGLLGAR